MKRSYYLALVSCASVLLMAAAVFVMMKTAEDAAEAVQEPEKAEELEQELRVMTFNLKVTTNEQDNFWRDRRPIIVELLEQEQPHIIGTQEGTFYQLEDLQEGIPEYDWIGQGQHGDRFGEHTAVFYKKERLELIEYGDFWLSDTPDVPGSLWSTAPKMVTWAFFTDKHTGKQFYVYNTHFDHHSQEVQHKSAELILQKIDRIPSEYPVLLTGDFNALITSETYEILTKDEILIDSFHVSEHVAGGFKGTFNNWWDNNGKGPIWRIDWILFRGEAEVRETKIIDFKKGDQYPSDHFPVMSEFIFL